MMRGLRWRACVLGVSLSLLVVLAGCGGGGSQPAPPTVTVTITSPTSAQTLQVNQTLAITASVSGTSNTAVTWKVNGVAGGNTTFGTISGSGLSVTYTAPASVPSPATFNIAVTSQADTSKSASLQVTIAPPVSVSITSPTGSPSVQVSNTLAITASVTGTTNTALTWKVNGVTNGNPTFGTITGGTSTSVTYTAPASVPSPATFAVTATSQADNTKTASLSVTITAGPVPVVVTITNPSSSTVSVQLSQTLAITVSVTGTTNTGLTWTVNAVTNGNSTVGTITGTYPNLTYHAPSAIPPGNPVTVTATSQADNTKSASLTVTLTPAAGQANPVVAEGNSTHTPAINFNLSSLTPTLALTDVGTCTGTPASCAAGATGFQVKQGATLTVWLLGQGLTDGTGASLAPGLAVSVSQGSTSDVTVSSVTPQCNSTGNPGTCPLSPALTNITFQIQVSASATLGQRNIIVTNSAGELQAYVGGIQIIAGP